MPEDGRTPERENLRQSCPEAYGFINRCPKEDFRFELLKMARIIKQWTRMKLDRFASGGVFLGIEAGGTRTVAAAMRSIMEPRSIKDGNLLPLEFGPANLRLLNDQQLIKHLQQIAKAMPRPVAVAIGMAGARTEADRERIRQSASKVWPDVPCYATNDLETALAGADGEGDRLKVRGRRKALHRCIVTFAGKSLEAEARVLVLSGTGSCCFGQTKDGNTIKIGGWGHLLGDKGSGYEIGLRALKAVVYYYDRDGVWSALGQRLLRTLQLNEPDDLIGWVQSASKTEVAALAIPGML